MQSPSLSHVVGQPLALHTYGVQFWVVGAPQVPAPEQLAAGV